MKDKKEIFDYSNREFENKCEEIHELNSKILYLNKAIYVKENKHKLDLEEIGSRHKEDLDFLNNENISLSIHLIFSFFRNNE